MEQLEKERTVFLSLCSPHDRDLLTGRIKMTLQDFERLTYLTMALDYEEYSLDLHKQHLDFTTMLSEQLERESQILAGYPDYYLDENTRNGLTISATIYLPISKSIIGIS